MNNALYQTKELITSIKELKNPNFSNALNVLEKNPGILKYQIVDGANQVIIHSSVGRLFQGNNKLKICQETKEVQNLLNDYYKEDGLNVEVIPSENVKKLCQSDSGGSKSQRRHVRKTHNKRAFKSKSKTQRRRRARHSRARNHKKNTHM
jgi:hypothetical protein